MPTPKWNKQIIKTKGLSTQKHKFSMSIPLVFDLRTVLKTTAAPKNYTLLQIDDKHMFHKFIVIKLVEQRKIDFNIQYTWS